MYSKGVFFRTSPKNRKYWKEQAEFINSLANIEHVEIWIEESLNLSEIKFIKSLLKYNIIIHAPFIELNLISCHPEIRETALKLHLETIKTAEKMNAKIITLHSGSKTKFQTKKEAVKLLSQGFKKIKGNIPLAVENLAPYNKGVFDDFLKKLKDFSYLKKIIPGIFFTLDIGHAFQNREDLNKIIKFLKKYRDSVLDIHIHDATLKGQAHMAFGKGDLDLMKFLKCLREISYNNFLTLETVSKRDTKSSWQKLLLTEKKLD